MTDDQTFGQALICPQCNAPLNPSRFASLVVCSHCGTTVKLASSSAVSARRFHEAFRRWNSPNTYHLTSSISLGNRHWALGKQIGRGDFSDVYEGQLVRWPTELVIVKLLRNGKDAKPFGER